VLLDRDGTVIEECHYLCDPAEVKILPGVAPGLRALQELGLLLIIVTNQSGIGRGYFDRAAVDAVHERLLALLADEGVTIDAIYTCPHAPEDDCTCRKPLPGLALRASEEHNFSPGASFVIGDKACDVELALNMGATPILVRTGYGAEHENKLNCTGFLCVDTLEDASKAIGRELGKRDALQS
jgi:histidinol-phosphate phosphatase family protein